MDAATLTLEQAVSLLELPRDLGVHPEMNEPIVAKDGRYGPYISCGKENRSLPAEMSPLTISIEQAIELLKQPRTRGGRTARTPKEPLRRFDKPSPVTEQEIKVLDGRFGPYVTDGESNASLPKGTTPEELTYEAALDLLAERAARAPKKKARTAKKKATTTKKAAKKAAKKATKKASPKKKGVAKKRDSK